MLEILAILFILIGVALGSAGEKAKQREIDILNSLKNSSGNDEYKNVKVNKVAKSPDEKHYKIGWRSNRDYADSIWTDSFARFRKLSKGQKKHVKI